MTQTPLTAWPQRQSPYVAAGTAGLDAGNGPLSQAAERRHLRLCAYRVSSFRADDGDQRCLGSWPRSLSPRQYPSIAQARHPPEGLTVASVNNEEGPYFAELLRVLDESDSVGRPDRT